MKPALQGGVAPAFPSRSVPSVSESIQAAQLGPGANGPLLPHLGRWSASVQGTRLPRLQANPAGAPVGSPPSG